jgi:phage terminase small subunit
MTKKQMRFVEEYLIDLNATQAALRAGYKETTAYCQGQRMLSKNVEVKKAIAAALAKRAKKSEITAEYVLSNLQLVVERCLQRAPVVNFKGSQVQDEEGRDVWSFNAPGANKALELLGKHLGMFTEKVDLHHSGTLDTRSEVRVALMEWARERGESDGPED